MEWQRSEMVMHSNDTELIRLDHAACFRVSCVFTQKTTNECGEITALTAKSRILMRSIYSREQGN